MSQRRSFGVAVLGSDRAGPHQLLRLSSLCFFHCGVFKGADVQSCAFLWVTCMFLFFFVSVFLIFQRTVSAAPGIERRACLPSGGSSSTSPPLPLLLSFSNAHSQGKILSLKLTWFDFIEKLLGSKTASRKASWAASVTQMLGQQWCPGEREALLGKQPSFVLFTELTVGETRDFALVIFTSLRSSSYRHPQIVFTTLLTVSPC